MMDNNCITDINANVYEDVERLAEIVRQTTRHRPTIGIICGSGLGKIAQTLEEQDILPYENLPGFPVSTVPGHAGRFVFGILEGKTVACMQGRVHPYEGYDYSKCTLPIRLMKLLGVETLILTNAVGGLNRSYKIGDLVVLKDHIFLPGIGGNGPLIGPNDERFGPRFVPMANAYDRKLRQLAVSTAKEMNIGLQQGIYCMNSGPQFETQAEIRYMLSIGADIVGMSVAHETIVARHCGLTVLAVSLVTNMCEVDINEDEDNACDVHAEVLEAGIRYADKASSLVRAIVKKI